MMITAKVIRRFLLWGKSGLLVLMTPTLLGCDDPREGTADWMLSRLQSSLTGTGKVRFEELDFFCFEAGNSLIVRVFERSGKLLDNIDVPSALVPDDKFAIMGVSDSIVEYSFFDPHTTGFIPGVSGCFDAKSYQIKFVKEKYKSTYRGTTKEHWNPYSSIKVERY